ncbi:MAG: phosphoribosylaminoimidazolesuccinocarboxamide synthase, partial [Polyangiaceae bacterium]|nr:phosphoribosylaminoimidazolesuccinocarboxamide synthase [Polyangiaceae bacterium]
FDKTKHVVPNHVLRVPDPNVLECVECEPVLVKIVVRSCATGDVDELVDAPRARRARLLRQH